MSKKLFKQNLIQVTLSIINMNIVVEVLINVKIYLMSSSFSICLNKCENKLIFQKIWKNVVANQILIEIPFCYRKCHLIE